MVIVNQRAGAIAEDINGSIVFCVYGDELRAPYHNNYDSER